MMSSKFRIIKRDLRSKISANITGASTQASTPTPTNPVEVKPLQTSGGMDVSDWNLHGLSGYVDGYNYQTKQITRRIGIIILTGTETWTSQSSGDVHIYYSAISNRNTSARVGICSHFTYSTGTSSTAPDSSMFYYASQNTGFRYDAMATVEAFQAWLAAQYAAGTPVIVYYPLATPTTDSSTPIYDESLIMRNTSLVPAGYTQLEYVESDGTQCIDTGYARTLNDDIECEFTDYNTGVIFGNIAIDPQTVLLRTGNSVFVKNLSSGGAGQLSISTIGRYKTLLKPNGEIYVNDSLVITQTTVGANSENMYLFGYKNASSYLIASAVVKLHKIRIGSARNLIPAKNSSNVVGLYDTVSGQFITPTTGTLIAGPELYTKQFMIIQNEEA